MASNPDGKHETALAEAVLALETRNPEAWTRFVDALRLWQTSLTNAYVSAPPSELQLHQGRVQVMRALVSALEDARKQVAVLEERKREHAYRYSRTSNGGP